MSSHAQTTPASPPPVPTYIQARRALPQDGFVRQDVLLQFVPFSKSTLWRRVRAGLFPAPLKLSVEERIRCDFERKNCDWSSGRAWEDRLRGG